VTKLACDTHNETHHCPHRPRDGRAARPHGGRGRSLPVLGADGSVTLVGTGPTLFFILFQGNPGITLLNGRFVLSIDAEGNQTFSSVGATRDLCAELAG
jgi:hypothetical protein